MHDGEKQRGTYEKRGVEQALGMQVVAWKHEALRVASAGKHETGREQMEASGVERKGSEQQAGRQGEERRQDADATEWSLSEDRMGRQF